MHCCRCAARSLASLAATITACSRSGHCTAAPATYNANLSAWPPSLGLPELNSCFVPSSLLPVASRCRCPSTAHAPMPFIHCPPPIMFCKIAPDPCIPFWQASDKPLCKLSELPQASTPRRRLPAGPGRCAARLSSAGQRRRARPATTGDADVPPAGRAEKGGCGVAERCS